MEGKKRGIEDVRVRKRGEEVFLFFTKGCVVFSACSGIEILSSSMILTELIQVVPFQTLMKGDQYWQTIIFSTSHLRRSLFFGFGKDQ